MTEPTDTGADPAVPLPLVAARPTSAFSLWRRRLSPLVLLFAIFVLGRESCAKKDSAPVVVKISATAFSSEISMIRGQLQRGDKVVTSFERQAVAGTLGTIELKIPGGEASGAAHLEVFVHNKMFEFDRTFQAPPGSTVTIDISDELTSRGQ